MPQRHCSKIKTEVTKISKRITLPVELEEYQQVIDNPEEYRKWLDEMIDRYRELFPGEIEQGYSLHDKRRSSKMPEISLRRIKLKARAEKGAEQVYTIAPSGVLPYMSGYTDEVEKALFLRRFGVPYWGLTYVFGRDDQYWYRLDNHLGRCDLVQTTLKAGGSLPQDLLADEKHTHFNGQKAYIATTVGDDCVLGASMSLSADTAGLTEAYSHFQDEAQQLEPDYQPQSVNTDGWEPTQNAWQRLFPQTVLMACFLHAFLKIRACAKKCGQGLFDHIRDQVWHCYHAPDPDQFIQRLTAFQTWAQQKVTGTALEAITKLCDKADHFLLAFEYPHAHRTSNMIDRHMLPLDRWLESTRFFHGHLSSAERQVRAWALFHNFGPYCPRAEVAKDFISPAHKLNQRVYHDNWLHNLLISTSLSGSDP